MKRVAMLGAFVLSAAASAAAEEPPATAHACPHHAATEKAASPTETHAHGVVARGDAAMGFSHQATTHHFRLRDDGGVIEVTANRQDDADSVARIRTHLRHIAKAFAAGDFTLPGIIHDQPPPGAETMKTRRSRIRYAFAELSRGAEVRLQTEDAAARSAIHEFLRFQIAEHRTGDPLVP